MEIKEIKIVDENWTNFLQKNEHLIFHIFPYKQFIEDAFGCHYRMLSIIDDGAIKAIFPFVEVRSRLFGNKIISSAYIEYGGFAGDKQYVNPLLDFMAQKYKQNNEYMEIRGGLEKFDLILSTRLIKKDLYKRFVLPLHDEQAVWNNIQHSKRKAINKALKEAEVKEVPLAELPSLYLLYCQNMRRFGSPPYSKKYFESFYQHLVPKGFGKIYGAYVQGKLVSALLGFCYHDRVHILIAVSDPQYQQYRPNDAVHWTFIRWACQNNYRWFDFGRVREDSGQFEYKQKWGPTLHDLPSYFLLWNIKDIPVMEPSSARYKAMVALWRKMPLGITKALGMKLRKGLGI